MNFAEKDKTKEKITYDQPNLRQSRPNKKQIIK